MRLPGPHQHGVVLGHGPDQVAFAQQWAYRMTGCGDTVNSSVATVAVALVTNAHRHTASGLDGGATRLVIDRGPFLIRVRVTDQGPRPGVVRYPLPELRPDRQGLRLVDRLSVCWDWSGSAGGSLTVTAMVERP
jgi:anti-sigma regulatory factor (Ser/Thr protein kinase)